MNTHWTTCPHCKNTFFLPEVVSAPLPPQESLFEVIAKLYSVGDAQTTATALKTLLMSRFQYAPLTHAMRSAVEATARHYLATSLPLLDMREWKAVLTEKDGSLDLGFTRPRKEWGKMSAKTTQDSRNARFWKILFWAYVLLDLADRARRPQ